MNITDDFASGNNTVQIKDDENDIIFLFLKLLLLSIPGSLL